MLGAILIQRGLIRATQLQQFLAAARHSRVRLGDVMVSNGSIGYQQLYAALAEHHRLPFVNLITAPPDIALLDARYLEGYLRHRAIPYHLRGKLLVIATSEYTQETIDWAHATFGMDVAFAITSPVDIKYCMQHYFADLLTHQSVMGLFENMPVQSARPKRPRTRYGAAVLIGMLFVLIATGVSPWTVIAFLAICHLLYGCTMLFKMLIFAAGCKPVAPDNSPEIPDADLPVYTILIPMYRETESMPHMLTAMRQMDYPQAKLDIKLVLEDDDDDTLDTAYALKPNYHFDIIRVPKSQPRTKPKACNYALRFARGEYVTVYDADDRPDPKQLRKAVAAFRSLPAHVICLQARLNYYNAQDNLLTRFFALEYAMLFHVLLPGMSRLSMPVLLGGTSNHISLKCLREMGEWDPFNVTEDADLGTRMAARGYTTAMLDSDTLEEAPNSYHAWFNQRTRWIKGYMQTWMVHMRSPLQLHRRLRARGFWGFQFFVALSSFSYLSAPLSWWFAYLGFTDASVSLPRWLFALAIANLGGYFLLHIGTALYMATRCRQHKPAMLMAAALYPFYLILHSIASYMALWQLFFAPSKWNKTMHGRAKTFSADNFSDFQLTNTTSAR